MATDKPDAKPVLKKLVKHPVKKKAVRKRKRKSERKKEVDTKGVPKLVEKSTVRKRSQPDRTIRETNGRFTKGSPGGPGRLPAQREAAYLRAVREAVTPEEMAELACLLLEKAMGGSIQAARLLCEHLLPKPTERMRIEQDFVMPWERDESEFRVAGASPDEIDRNVFDFVADMVRKQQAAGRGGEVKSEGKKLPGVSNVISEQ